MYLILYLTKAKWVYLFWLAVHLKTNYLMEGSSYTPMKVSKKNMQTFGEFLSVCTYKSPKLSKMSLNHIFLQK